MLVEQATRARKCLFHNCSHFIGIVESGRAYGGSSPKTEHVGRRVDTVGRSSGLKFGNPVEVSHTPRLHRDALGLEIAARAENSGEVSRNRGRHP
jgi:hypothetical protein